MALQDLTPQLRTRLSRVERAVGWFILLATALLVFGFGYYLYKTAERKGWFVRKIVYETSIRTGEGLKVGDPVKLTGFDVGEIASIERNAPDAWYNVTVDFWIRATNSGYIWSDSKVKVNDAGFLGSRYLEITKGVRGVPTTLENTDKVPVSILINKYVKDRKAELSRQYTNEEELYVALNKEAKANSNRFYTNLTGNSMYWLEPDETPALTERAQALVAKVEDALPGILAITNRINALLDNTTHMTSNLNVIAENARPMITNLAVITDHLRDTNGSLGEWLIPTNLNYRLDTTLRDADTNLVVLAQALEKSLNNLADITSNLNKQVQVNSNILSNISSIVVHSDELVQGLKHHWLLRSAFKSTNAPSSNPAPSGQSLQSPKTKNQGP